ncbi:MAG: hypothetical protein JSW52_11900 [Candidatus Coatesbacteria bacterium]|nr:MAG: hypothetical protein JSW52_11900 [Candidatus Coatesbacteria bacterium]
MTRPKVNNIILFAFLIGTATLSSAGSVGWSRASPEYDFVAVAVGYDYDVPVGPWKRSVIAPVDQFNPGHGVAINVALQGRWFRFALTVDYTAPNTDEWEAYANEVGFDVDSASRFWYAGASVGVNPWYTKTVSPYCGVYFGLLRPWGRDKSEFHRATYNYLADGRYSFYIGPELAIPVRLANQVYVIPSAKYLSASKTTLPNHENHRVNNLIWSVKFEWRIPLSLF